MPVQSVRPSAGAPSTCIPTIGRTHEVRQRLISALRDRNTMNGLRAALVEVICDLGSGLHAFDPPAVDQAADTIRCPAGPDFEPDSAPPVPVERPSGGP